MLAEVKHELETSVAAFAASPSATKASVFADLVKVILNILEKHVGIDADSMAEYVGKLYDLYIEPMDIPGVPEVMEGTVDKVLKATLEAIVRRTIQNIQVQ